jgi:hypothetical protein
MILVSKNKRKIPPTRLLRHHWGCFVTGSSHDCLTVDVAMGAPHLPPLPRELGTFIVRNRILMAPCITMAEGALHAEGSAYLSLPREPHVGHVHHATVIHAPSNLWWLVHALRRARVPLLSWAAKRGREREWRPV